MLAFFRGGGRVDT